jgi:tellurite resistance-related uncharacterized protein
MNEREAELPGGLLPYKRTPIFDEKTMPAGLRRRHSTKLSVWGLIRVIEGRLLYRILDASSEIVLDPENPGVIRPAQLHEVAPLGRVRFFVEFYADAATTGKVAREPGRGEASGDSRDG